MKDRTLFLMLIVGVVAVTLLIWGLSLSEAVSPGTVLAIAIVSVIVLPAGGAIWLDQRRHRAKRAGGKG